MTYLEEIIEAFKYEVERSREEFTKPKGGQQVTPSGDFIRIPPSALGRLEWWARAMDFAAKQDREKTQREKELEDLTKAKDEITRLKKDLGDLHLAHHHLITRLMAYEREHKKKRK